MNERTNASLNDIKDVALSQDLWSAPTVRPQLPSFTEPSGLPVPPVWGRGADSGLRQAHHSAAPSGGCLGAPLQSPDEIKSQSLGLLGTEKEGHVGRGTRVRRGSAEQALPGPGPLPGTALAGRRWAARQAGLGRSRGVCYRPPGPLQGSF